MKEHSLVQFSFFCFFKYDLNNTKDAKKFLYNSFDDELKKQLNENCTKECSFVAYWLELIHAMRSVSMERFDKIRERLKKCKITDYDGENVEKLASDYLADYEELDSAAMYDHNLNLNMLNAILDAGGPKNEGFKFPLRASRWVWRRPSSKCAT